MARKLLLGVLFAAFVATPFAQSSVSKKRAVFLNISWQGKERPSKLAALEGEGATAAIPNVGQFKFTPTVKADGKAVVVTISDVSTQPAKDLGTVEVIVGGKPVSSKTKPAFEVQAESVK